MASLYCNFNQTECLTWELFKLIWNWFIFLHDWFFVMLNNVWLLVTISLFFHQDIFVTLSKVDSNYFVCNVDDFKFLADMIQHIPLHLRARYVFCCAPINKKHPFISTMFLKVRYVWFKLVLLKTWYFWFFFCITTLVNLVITQNNYYHLDYE